MAIQNTKETEVVIVYNPTLEAYQEISLVNYKLQLESLGLSETEVREKIQKVLEQHKKRLEDLGLNKKEVAEILKNYE